MAWATPRHGVRISAEPFERELRRRGIPVSEDGPLGMRGYQTLRRARESGFTYWRADELCITILGEHPLLVWGDEWREADELMDAQAIRKAKVEGRKHWIGFDEEDAVAKTA